MTEESAGAVGVAQSSASWLSARSLLLVAAVVLALPLVLPIWAVGALVLGVPAAIWLASPKGASAAAPVEEEAQPHGGLEQDAEPTALNDQVGIVLQWSRGRHGVDMPVPLVALCCGALHKAPGFVPIVQHDIHI